MNFVSVLKGREEKDKEVSYEKEKPVAVRGHYPALYITLKASGKWHVFQTSSEAMEHVFCTHAELFQVQSNPSVCHVLPC